MIRKLSVYLLSALIIVAAWPARADINVTPGSGAIVFDFTCFSTKHCPIAVLTDANGAALATAPGTPNTSFALPIQGVTGGTAVPISGNVTNAGTFAVQATLQASATTAIGKIDPNTVATWGLAAVTQNVAAPTNGLLGLCQFTTSPATISTTNVSPLQCDNLNNLLVKVSNASPNGAHNIANSPTVNIASDQIGTAGSAASPVLTVQGIASMTPVLVNPGTLANFGVVATAAAPPANAVYLGANASGATGGQVRGLINCDNHVFKHITTATDTLAVQGVASQTIYVCGATGAGAGTATFFLENTASTNANCSSANTQIAGLQTVATASGGGNYNPIWGGLKNTSGNGLCINSTGTGGVDVDVWYTQF